MPTQEELKAALYRLMTEGTHADSGHAMHGGSFGRDSEKRNELAEQVANTIAAHYPADVTEEESAQIVTALDKKLKGFTARDAFQKHFEETKESFGADIGVASGVPTPTPPVPQPKTVPSTPTSFVPPVPKPKMASTLAGTLGSATTTPPPTSTVPPVTSAAPPTISAETQAVQDQLVSFLKTQRLSDADAQSKAAALMASGEFQDPKKVADAAVDLTQNMPQGMTAQAVVAMHAGANAAIKDIDDSKKYTQAVKDLSILANQKDQLSEANIESLRATKLAEKFAETHANDITQGFVDPEALNASLQGLGDEAKLAFLVTLRGKVEGKEGVIAEIDTAMDESKLITYQAGATPENREETMTATIAGVAAKIELDTKTLEEISGNAGIINVTAQALQAQHDQAPQAWEQQKAEAIARAAAKVKAQAPALSEREQAVQRNRERLAGAKQTAAQVQKVADAQGIAYGERVESEGVFRGTIADANKAQQTFDATDRSPEQLKNYQTELEGPAKAFAAQMLKQSALTQDQRKLLTAEEHPEISLEMHEEKLQAAPREFQAAVMRALEAAIDTKIDKERNAFIGDPEDFTPSPEVQNLQKWQQAQAIAVENGVSFNPAERDSTEQRFMQAAMQRHEAETEKEAEAQAGIGGSRFSKTDAEKAFQEADQEFVRARQALSLQQEALGRANEVQGSAPAYQTEGQLIAAQGAAIADADSRLQEASKQKAAVLSHMERFDEARERVRRESLGRTELFDSVDDRLNNARKQVELAARMQEDTYALGRDLGGKTREMNQEGGFRNRIAALNLQQGQNKEDIKARAVELVIASGKPPFHKAMDREEKKKFAEAVDKKVKEETSKLDSLQTELGARSRLSTDAITKMERAHKDMLVINEGELDRLHSETSVNVQVNEDLVRRTDLLKKGVPHLTAEEQVELVSATGRLAIAGMLESPDREVDNASYNRNVANEVHQMLPADEKLKLEQFQCEHALGELAAGHQNIQSEYTKLLGKKDQAKQGKKDDKGEKITFSDEETKNLEGLESQLSSNKEQYAEQKAQLNIVLNKQQELVVDAIEKQKEVTTFSGKFQAFVNDNIKSGLFEEGEKVLNARKLKELETKQVTLDHQITSLNKEMDLHRNSFLDAKKEYEGAKVELEDQLQRAEHSMQEFRGASAKLQERSRDPKVMQAQEAMEMLQERDRARGAAVESAGVGKKTFREIGDALLFSAGQGKALPTRQGAQQQTGKKVVPATKKPGQNSGRSGR